MKTTRILLTALVIIGCTFGSFAQRKKTVVVIDRVPRSKIEYRKAIPKSTVVRTIPSKAKVIQHNKLNYYFREGRYYRHINGKYILAKPPVGLAIATLPAAFVKLRVGTAVLFYSEGVFYQSVSSKYKVVDPPMNAIVPELPDGAEKVSIDRQTYFEYYGVLYKQVRTENGRAYKVVGKVDDDR